MLLIIRLLLVLPLIAFKKKWLVSGAFLLPLFISLIYLKAIGFQIDPLTSNYLINYLFFFLIGVLIQLFKRPRISLKRKYVYIRRSYLLGFLVLCSFLYLGLNIDRFYEIITNGYFRSTSESSVLSSLIEMFINISAFFFSFEFWKYKRRVDLFPIILVLIVAFFSASRAVLIIHLIFLGGAGLFAHDSRKILLRIIVLGIFILLGVFSIIGFFRGSFSDSKEFILMVNSYAFGGLAAFQTFFAGFPGSGWNLDLFNVIPGLAKLFNLLGFSFEVNNYKYSAISSPFLTNIYTSFREVIVAFGIYGSLLFALLHGYVSSYSDQALNYFHHKTFTLAPLILTANIFFLFYPVTMYMFVVVYLLFILIFKLKS